MHMDGVYTVHNPDQIFGLEGSNWSHASGHGPALSSGSVLSFVLLQQSVCHEYLLNERLNF